jgi:hypothetical protein
MDGIDGNFERRLEPEKAAGPGESLTEGIMASADQQRKFCFRLQYMKYI